MSSRRGRGGRDAVDFVVFIRFGGIFFVFFVRFFSSSFERTRPAASMRPPCLIYLSISSTPYLEFRRAGAEESSATVKYGMENITKYISNHISCWVSA